jgi:hypothetical protein
MAAGPGRKECLDAADDGQRLRDEGKLTAAREKFITCSAKTCPAVVAKECGRWLEDAQRELPSVSLRVLDEQGKEILGTKVSLDGNLVVPSEDGRATSIDPGEHAIHVERADGASIDQTVVVRPGEKNRIVELAFPRSQNPPKPAEVQPAAVLVPPPPERKEPFHITVLGWAGLGVGVAGGATMAVFALTAKGDEKDLRATCAPNCASSDRTRIDTKILAANVGMAVGILGLGVAVVSTVLANTGSAPPSVESKTAVALDLGPGRVGVHGSF